MIELQKGDVVTLNSGGQSMTIASIEKSAEGLPVAVCCYFGPTDSMFCVGGGSGTRLHYVRLDPVCLKVQAVPSATVDK
jgi:uncharacterized protein YodC (DUF2158 family)